MRMRFFGLVYLMVLAGCTPSATALYDSVRLVRGAASDPVQTGAADTPLLTITHPDGRQTRMALGYSEGAPAPLQGQTDVWFSSDGALLKLWRGRIVGTAGWPVDWLAVRLPALPQWSELPTGGLRYVRERDVMPAYRYGLRDSLHMRALAPSDPRLTALPAGLATSSAWFEEAHDEGPWPPSLFAVATALPQQPVVYSRQCLAPSHCIELQLHMARQGVQP